MGIKDLLRFMKTYIEPVHIKKYSGKRVGIDAYSWLHKGAYSCSMEICLDLKGDKRLRYLEYFMHRINLLRHYKITPVVVFDGASVPCKAATENERHRRREANHKLAMEKLKEGNVNAASDFFQRAVSITPLMARKLIQILRSENVEFVVAPYEADAQLAYLSSLEAEKGGIAAVITEDSDLLAYGCQAIIFKMDRYGNGEEMVLDKVFDAGACKPSFKYFNKELFIGMCVLAGCDFLPSVPGIGIVKAHSYVSKYRNLDRVLSVLKLEKGSQMPEDYSKSFKEALAVFQHARIYDAETKKLRHMKPLPQNLLDSLDGQLDFLGPELPPSVATAIAEGNLNPSNMEAFDYFPSSECQPDPIVIQNPCMLQKDESTVVSRRKGCFISISSRKAREKDTTGMAMNEDPVVTERKYINEAITLQKLIMPQEILSSTEKVVLPDEAPLKIPNNPFAIKSTTEARSVVLENDNSNLLCSTPDRDPSNDSGNSPSKKRKQIEIDLHQKESTDEQASEVIDVEMYVTKESQESVNSRPRKISNRKVRSKFEKPKKCDCKTADNKQNTILNFFSRV
ncbi:exonuclease 1 isoform X1 [Jatropha curcas]|uniref:exonuclease 1 isoform X1 n=1 Tax=Jatropha curcas TaxID=180498 RepID=UPI0009D75546|nr:exonuclease 1 isoform X1 [Jatropha curcas]